MLAKSACHKCLQKSLKVDLLDKLLVQFWFAYVFSQCNLHCMVLLYEGTLYPAFSANALTTDSSPSA